MTTPKLRFKEFDGDWSKNTIQSFMDNNYILDQMDGNHGELYPKAEEFSISGVPYISATDFSNGEVDFSSCKKLPVQRAKLFKKGIARNGDVLFAHNATVGPVALLKTDLDFVILSTTATYYRCNHQFLSNQYLKNYFASDYFVQQYFGIMSQSTRNQVPITTQRKLSISIPSLEEQTKIASFLSNVDEKISQLTQKHALLSQYKQGMMQKLFSQQIRFKADDGSEFAEWESKTLGEIIKFVNGKGHENDVDSDGSYTLINSKFLSTDGNVAKKVNKCNQKVMNDSLVMVMSDVPNGKALAKVMYIEDGSKFALNQRIGMFIFYKDHYPKFFQYQLNRHQYYLAFDSGVGQTNLKKENVLNCPILVPCIEEQTKIANFLSAIDQKIDVVKEQLEQAKLWKKGLLQQMFV